MNFTTRSSEGSDDLLRNIPYNSLISIHAPARGATTAFFALVKLGLFQSTLPRRERHNEHKVGDIWFEFQSTLPRRERRDGLVSSLPALISIHAPAKGATIRNYHLTLITYKFQSTLPRRERPLKDEDDIFSDIISIHAPAKGATIL